MKIFAFAGSTSSASINKQFVASVLQQFQEDEINFIDLRDYDLPLYSVDKEKEGFPENARRFLQNITDCDAIVCSLAEHNRSYSAAFKNMFDWVSRINVKLFQQKPMLLLSASPGGYGGGNVMAEASKFFPQFDAKVVATFSLPKFYENFDAGNGITDPQLKDQLVSKIAAFKEAVH